MKKIFLYILLIFFAFANISNINASTSTVGPYNSKSECEKIRNKNNSNTESEYQRYERSKCYLNNGKYEYAICKKGEGCINLNNSSKIKVISNEIAPKYNPYGNYQLTIKGKNGTIENFFGKKIKLIIQRIKGKNNKTYSIIRLKKFDKKLVLLLNKEKYKNNQLVQNLIKYIRYEIKTEIEKLQKQIAEESEENGLNDFLCELEDKKDCKTSVCTMEYAPVCAQPKMIPCPKGRMCPAVMPNKKTYPNACMAKKAGAKILYKGKCKTKPISCAKEGEHLKNYSLGPNATGPEKCCEGLTPYTPKGLVGAAPVCKKIIPLSCKKWYDGCNECSVSNGKIGICTQKACIKHNTPKCLKY